MFVRPARSSTFPDPMELEPQDWEAEHLDQESDISEPHDADPEPLVVAKRKVWTRQQVEAMEDLAAFLDWWSSDGNNG